MLQEFREFIMRGNVLDLAVGIIIGAAFTAIVTSLVNDIIMPPIGLALSGVDFSDIVITLQEAQGEDTPAVTINIGNFINEVINFLIVALVVFLIVRWFNRMARMYQKEEDTPAEDPAPSTEELMLEELKAMRAALEKQEAP